MEAAPKESRAAEHTLPRPETHLRDLPHLVGRENVVREYETVGAGRTEENPLGLYKLTRESIRYLDEEELEAKRREAEEERAARFRELYAMLDLRVVCHKDRSLEVTWGGDCSEWLSRGWKQVGATPCVAFRATIGADGEVGVRVAL